MIRRLLALSAILGFAVPLAVWAQNVSVDNDIKLVLPSDGSSYSLAPSTLNSLTVNSTSFSFDMAGGQRVTLRSGDRKSLSNTLNVSTQCGTSESSIVLFLEPGAASQTVTVTPSGTCGGGGGGGGIVSGSGSGSYSSPSEVSVSQSPAVPAPGQSISDLQAKLAGLLAQANTLRGGSSVAVITRDLGVGSRGDDVERLQQLLASDPAIYPEGQITGYFGDLTVQAVKRFQARYGLPQVGRVGPLTRAKLAEIFGAGGTTPSAVETPAAPQAVGLTKALSLGARGDEVTILQQILAQDKEIYPEATVSGYFGPLTDAAVKRFQEKYGIADANDPGYGFVGPKTRAKLNELK